MAVTIVRGDITDHDVDAIVNAASSHLPTGVYGYPLEAGCQVALETLLGAPGAVGDIHIVAFDDATRRTFERLGAAA